MVIPLGPLQLRVGDVEVAHVGTPGNEPSLGVLTGRARVGLVTGPGGVNVELGYVTWPNDSREILTLSVGQSPPAVQYAGARTTLFSERLNGAGARWMHLRALSPKIGDPSRPSAQTVTRAQLDWILGESFEGLVLRHGALAFGTGAETRGDTTKTRNWLNVAFDPDDVTIPLVAFAVTRQLARMRGFDKSTWSD